MSLHIYTDDDPATELSEGKTFTSPLRVVKNNNSTDDIIVQLYIRDDTGSAYTSVAVTPTPTTKIGASSVDGWAMKVLDGKSGAPSEDDWDGVSPANTFTVDAGDVGSFAVNTYYHPIYINLYIPAGTAVQSTRAISLQIDAS